MKTNQANREDPRQPGGLHLRGVWCALALLCLVAETTVASAWQRQSTSDSDLMGSISGRVTTANGAGLANARIHVYGRSADSPPFEEHKNEGGQLMSGSSVTATFTVSQDALVNSVTLYTAIDGDQYFQLRITVVAPDGSKRIVKKEYEYRHDNEYTWWNTYRRTGHTGGASSGSGVPEAISCLGTRRPGRADQAGLHLHPAEPDSAVRRPRRKSGPQHDGPRGQLRLRRHRQQSDAPGDRPERRRAVGHRPGAESHLDHLAGRRR